MPASLRTLSQVPLPPASVLRYTVPATKLPQAAKTVSVAVTSVRIARSVQPTSGAEAEAVTTFVHEPPPSRLRITPAPVAAYTCWGFPLLTTMSLT
jgi:hypothetical protein